MWQVIRGWFERRDMTMARYPMLVEAPTAAGIVVTPRHALGVPAVYASIVTLAQDVAKTPTRLRRRIADDTYTDATEHGLWEVLHDLSNPETSAFSFKHQMMVDLLTYENAFAEIVRADDGQVTALWRLDPERVTVDRDSARRKRWRYTDEHGTTHTWLFDPSTPPIFEITHPSPLQRCRDLIATAIALQRYTGRFFANGARPTGVLTTDSELDADQAEGIRSSFNKWHQGVDNAHRIAVLENGVKFQAIAPPNDTAQLNETLQTIRTEIAAAFRLAPWKVGDVSKMTFSNMESSAIEHVNGTLDPYFTCWNHSSGGTGGLVAAHSVNPPPRLDAFGHRRASCKSCIKRPATPSTPML
jgi:HK97 family phage portal protein